MAKYIDADALKQKVYEHRLLFTGQGDDVMMVNDIIDDMPAADVEPVRHGKWDYADWPSKTSNRFCSVCGCSEKIYAYNKDEFKYCRQYWAKMDRGSE